MSVEYNLCFLLLIGLVRLAALDSKVYILSNDGLTSLESNAVDSQELRSKIKDGRSLYSGLFHSKPLKLNYKKEYNKNFDEEYDYDAYFRKDEKNKFCYGYKCYLYLPGKRQVIETKSDRDNKNSRPYSAYLVKGRTDADYEDINDGYKRDDESNDDDIPPVKSQFLRCPWIYKNNRDCYRRSSTTTTTTTTTTEPTTTTTEPTTTTAITTTHEKTIDEKATEELTVDDSDAMVPDDNDDDITTVKNQFLRCPWIYKNNRDCYRPSSTTTTTTTTTTTEPTTTTAETTTHEKTVDEKATEELTEDDLDAMVPDDFEQRTDKESEGERKFSTDYIDIDDLYKIFMRSNGSNGKNADQEVTIDKGIVEIKDLLAALPKRLQSDKDEEDASKQLGEVYSKEYVRELRRPEDSEDETEGRKWGVKKQKKKVYTTPSTYADSSGDSDTSDIPAEDSSMERDSESQSTEKRRPSKDINKPNRFKVVKHKQKYKSNSMSKENSNFADSTETIEPVSKEVKPKPKKKSKSRIPGKPESYMQSFSRLYKEGKDFRKKKEDFDDFILGLRKRMPHFMPKRYHWDTEDFQKLGYFWFNGPQGKVPGPWRIAY